jgi:hypothetical protein
VSERIVRWFAAAPVPLPERGGEVQ